MLLSSVAAMPGDASPQGHILSMWVQPGLGGFETCLPPATCVSHFYWCEPASVLWFFPSGLVLLLLALLAGGQRSGFAQGCKEGLTAVTGECRVPSPAQKQILEKCFSLEENVIDSVLSFL